MGIYLNYKINTINMKSIIHKSDTRGHMNYGWLDTHYTFSFANYYDPERIHFGALRVLNDDYIEGGQGFGKHPHDNMEIITIPLEGELEHKDSMGNTFIIRKNDVQIMSAGTGIFHSEFNHLPDKPVKLFQIWVFPEKKNITPRYDQKTYNPENRRNQWQRIVSPHEKEAVIIKQDTYFSMINMDENTNQSYKFNNNSNGAYIFVIEGLIEIDDINLEKRDGIGIWETNEITITAKNKSEILLMEVPMMP